MKEILNLHCPEAFSYGNHWFTLSWKHFLKEVIDFHCPGDISYKEIIYFHWVSSFVRWISKIFLRISLIFIGSH